MRTAKPKREVADKRPTTAAATAVAVVTVRGVALVVAVVTVLGIVSSVPKNAFAFSARTQSPNPRRRRA
jgi:hypothetical protein